MACTYSPVAVVVVVVAIWDGYSKAVVSALDSTYLLRGYYWVRMAPPFLCDLDGFSFLAVSCER